MATWRDALGAAPVPDEAAHHAPRALLQALHALLGTADAECPTASEEGVKAWVAAECHRVAAGLQFLPPKPKVEDVVDRLTVDELFKGHCLLHVTASGGARRCRTGFARGPRRLCFVTASNPQQCLLLTGGCANNGCMPRGRSR